MASKSETGVYLTSFCNQGHEIRTGKPVEHECYVLVPAAIRAEMDDKVTEYLASGAPVHHGRVHKGS